MGPALDALNPAPQPLTARRPAASNLPVFELPPPTNFGLANPAAKFPSPSSVSNLLTPPSNHSGEGTTLAPGPSIPAAISAAQQEVPPYPPSWQNPNSYTYGSPSQASWGQSSAGVYPPSRSVLSPSSGSLSRNSGSLPPTSEGMAQQYDLNHLPPPFQQQSIPTSSPAPATSILPHAQHPQSMGMTHSLPTTTAGPSHQMATVDLYGSRPLVSPLYNASPSAGAGHPSTYAPSYGGPSPVNQSGLGIHTPRIQSGPAQSPPMQPPQLGYNRPPWPSYSLPAMTGPIMTNVHNPNGQMSLMGNMATTMMPGFTSGHLASMQHMYGSHPSHHQGHGQSAPPNDRPFKCDQCPQSFNRNHDLKRHKRIHLSVKPFPCTHCEKSFSRKDALKRHLLVKGCGKNTDTSSNSGAKDDEGLTKIDSQSDKASPLSNGI